MSPPPAAYVAVVTGASGYVATEIVSQLLAKAYTVRATVRSAKASEKVAHLQALGEALPGTLSLHEADLLEEGSFDEVLKGADYVFHTASPFKLGVKDAQKELIQPALEGTKNVLSSVVKNKSTVKRVVLTSSFVAVVKPSKGPSNGKVFTDQDWNDEAKADPETGYYLSKTLAEKEAWELSKQHDFDLVVVNPTAVYGPVISGRADGESFAAVKDLIENKAYGLFPWQTDVRDVAKAHVSAAEVPSAKGRYLVSTDYEVPPQEVVKALQQRFPQYKFDVKVEEAESKPFLDVSKVQKELGLSITPWQTSLIDMVVSLVEKGLATPVPAN